MFVGFLSLMLFVPATILLTITLIGPFVIVVGFFMAKLLGYGALVSHFGRWVAGRRSAEVASVAQIVIGVVIVAVLRYTPLFGLAFTVVASAWSLGAVLDTKFRTNRPWLTPKKRAPA